MKTSKDGRVIFDESTHTYKLGDRILTGVTTLISRYKNKFDAPAMAARISERENRPVSDVLKEWEKKGEDSRIAGTAVHSVFENYVLHNKIVLPGVHQKENIAVKFITEMFMTGRITPVDAEIIVYNEKIGIASQIDFIGKNSINQYFIFDWKTNSKIESNGYGKKMFTPFQGLPDCSLSHYSLQLNIYKKLYEENPVDKLFLVHIDTEDYKIIPIRDMNLDLNVLL